MEDDLKTPTLWLSSFVCAYHSLPPQLIVIMSDMRPVSPDPWPSQFQPSGALHGTLPLLVPRPLPNSAQVTIVRREEGVTIFKLPKPAKKVNKKDKSGRKKKEGNDEEDEDIVMEDEGQDTGDEDDYVYCRIDTFNEWVLLRGIHFNTDKDVFRLKAGRAPLARIIAAQLPNDNPARVIVDHANRDVTDNTLQNLHWVTARFNVFNRLRKPNKSSNFRGVQKQHRRWEVCFQGHHSSYAEVETAACVFNLLNRLLHGDQLDECPDLLNKVNEERVALISTQSDGVTIHQVNSVYLVIHDLVVCSTHDEYSKAKKAAESVVSNLKAEKERKEAEWEAIKKSLVPDQRESDGAAFFELTNSKGETIEVIVDDDVWKDLVARSASLFLLYKSKYVALRVDKQHSLLARWVRHAESWQVVDHKSGDSYDNRRDNLRAVDRAANSQNFRRARGEFGWIGVAPNETGRWEVKCKIKGESRYGYACFDDLDTAIELYDLTALHMHGAGALLNRPEKESEYLSLLEDDKTIKRIESFLTASVQTSPFQGVSKKKKGGSTKDDVWLARLELGGKARTKEYKMSITGAEVKAAICYDLFRLTADPHLTVNFERMRPYYEYCLKNFKNYGDMAEKAYQRLGGDEFAQAREEQMVRDGIRSM